MRWWALAERRRCVKPILVREKNHGYESLEDRWILVRRSVIEQLDRTSELESSTIRTLDPPEEIELFPCTEAPITAMIERHIPIDLLQSLDRLSCISVSVFCWKIKVAFEIVQVGCPWGLVIKLMNQLFLPLSLVKL